MHDAQGVFRGSVQRRESWEVSAQRRLNPVKQVRRTPRAPQLSSRTCRPEIYRPPRPPPKLERPKDPPLNPLLAGVLKRVEEELKVPRAPEVPDRLLK